MAEPTFLEFVVLVASPSDFISWPAVAKIDRYERVMQWHDFVAHNSPSRIPFAWGTHQLLSHTDLSSLVSLAMVVYRVQSLSEFDRLMEEDPLRDVSRYTTWAVSPLADDRQKDITRFNRLKQNLFGTMEEAEYGNKPGWTNLRSQYINAPDYVGKHVFRAPPMPLRTYRESASSDRIEVFIHGTNPPGLMDWSDAKQLISYEKVLWWHDYIAMLIERGQVSHAWTAKDFCDSTSLKGNTEAAQVVYSVKDLDEFGDLYSLDPLRLKGDFWSILLQPIEQQRQNDEMRLLRAKQRYPRL
jgi:hypothetical protein